MAQQLKIKNFPFKMYDKKGNLIYHEDSNGFWIKREYNEKGNIIYWEDSHGNWLKRKYDDNGNEIYHEESNGYWKKITRQYDHYERYWFGGLLEPTIFWFVIIITIICCF